ncbi:MAG: type 1 glutamine amidotransferase domain-containing protein [Cyclonatronaceae bacterium]
MFPLEGKKILIFIEDIYEDMELLYPKYRLTEAGATITVAGPEKDSVYRGKNGYPSKSDESYNHLDAGDFDALVIPGGFAPDKLRRSEKVLELTRRIHEEGKPLAHICHAGWVPISAGIMKGYRCTSTPGIKDDLINAGADWVDREVVVDRNMITSRRPDDLPAFCREIIKMMSA